MEENGGPPKRHAKRRDCDHRGRDRRTSLCRGTRIHLGFRRFRGRGAQDHRLSRLETMNYSSWHVAPTQPPLCVPRNALSYSICSLYVQFGLGYQGDRNANSREGHRSASCMSGHGSPPSDTCSRSERREEECEPCRKWLSRRHVIRLVFSSLSMVCGLIGSQLHKWAKQTREHPRPSPRFKSR